MIVDGYVDGYTVYADRMSMAVEDLETAHAGGGSGAGLGAAERRHAAELTWWWAYPAVLGIIFVSCAGLYVLPRRAKWL